VAGVDLFRVSVILSPVPPTTVLAFNYFQFLNVISLSFHIR
jgi:hypothetical protein